MDPSGVIFVVLAVAWAAYLIPRALRHHDEIARTRSIDRFSTAMRVLAHRDDEVLRGPQDGSGDPREGGRGGRAPWPRRSGRLRRRWGSDDRLRLSPVRGKDNPRLMGPPARVRAPIPAPPATAAGEPPPSRRVSASRSPAAARVAARRRRRILLVLLLATLGVVGLGAGSLVPWWSVAVPGGLTLAWLVVCRLSVRSARRAHRAGRPAPVPDEWVADERIAAPTTRRAARVEAPYGVPLAPPAEGPRELAEPADPPQAATDHGRTGVPAVDVVEVAAVETDGGGSLWDPLPVTLPTYVGKPKAHRTVRTIELGEPGTWSSGRNAEDSALVAEADGSAAAEGDEEADADGTAGGLRRQRAVGS